MYEIGYSLAWKFETHRQAITSRLSLGLLPAVVMLDLSMKCILYDAVSINCSAILIIEYFNNNCCSSI